MVGEIFADPRRLFGGSAALEEGERPHRNPNDEDPPAPSRKLSHCSLEVGVGDTFRSGNKARVGCRCHARVTR